MSAPRRLLQVVAFLCTLVVGVASMAVIVTQTAWFKEWLRGFIVRQAEDYVNGRLSIGRLGGNLFFGVEFEDVNVSMEGRPALAVDDIALDYSVLTWLRGDIVLDDIRLTRPVLHLRRTAEGWNLARLVRTRTPDPDEPRSRPSVEIGEIAVTGGTVFVEGQPVGTSGVALPGRVDDLEASIGVTSSADELTVDVDRLSLHAPDRSLTVEALSGVVRRTPSQLSLEDVSLRTAESALRVEGVIGNIEGETPTLEIAASSDRLTLAEIARVVPALQGFTLTPSFEVTAKGPVDRLAVDLQARDESVGELAGDLLVNAAGPGRRVSGSVKMTRFDYGPIVAGLSSAPASREPVRRDVSSKKDSRPHSQSDITGEATIDLALPSDTFPLNGTFAVNAPRAQVAGYEARNVVARGRIDGDTIRLDAAADAYGGRTTAAGTVRTGRPLALRLSGRASDVDLRNLPASLRVPAVPSRLDLEYTVEGRGDVFSGTATFAPSSLAGATIAAGTTAGFTVGEGAPRYSVRGQVADLDLQQIGQSFGIDALAADRYRSRINGQFDLTGSGGGRFPLTIDADGTLANSTVFEASIPQMAFTVGLADGDAHIVARGEFSNLDPAVVSGNERVAGEVAGAVDADIRLMDYADGVTADSVAVEGRLTLRESTVARLTLTRAEIEGRYADRGGTLDRVELTGPDVSARASGPVSLGADGSSNLTVHLETASLDRIGEIVGQPLKGSAVIDATISGNGGLLDVTGTLKGSDIGHGDNEALGLASDFNIGVPDLAFDRASVRAKSMVTFLEIGGQRVTELTATTTFSQSTLEFEATAQEGQRELDAAGTVVFHTDHQEIHLPRLALRAEGLEWRTPMGSDATIRYAKDRIGIGNLQLVNANQRLVADGVLGSPDEALEVTIENVDVGQVDRLLLGDERIRGSLSGKATLRGPLDDLRAEGEVRLVEGAFRSYTFQSLAGRVSYVKNGVDLDVRLQQSPTEWLTAKGHAPLTLFRANPDDVSGHVEPTPGDTVDLEVASSEIGLGLVQGFTSYVTDVTGVVRANLTVTGSGYDPHIGGAVEIRGGSFSVPQLGTAYSGLDTRLGLTPEGISIQEFKVLDDRGFPMTVGGTLAMHAREVGAVDVRITSDRFEVIDNELADLKLNSDIRVTGEIRRPRIVGTVEVENGTIHVARLLEQVTSDPYATEAATLPQESPVTADQPVKVDEATPRTADQAAAKAEPAPPAVFDVLEMDVALTIPDNLVLRGNDVRAANAPIALGDVNLTAGGQLQIRKTPGIPLSLTGDVNTVRGTYTFQGRRFEIMRDGRIRFAGGDEINPLLDVRARRVISGVETFVRVQGTLRAPELSFSSSPPLDQADILSLIVFNQPINQLGEGQQASLAERAGALAGGYLTSGLSRSIASALELDEFEIQAQGEAGSGPSISIGEQVGRNLFFRVRQAFGAAQTTELILEYQIAEFLRLQTSLSEGSSSAQRVQFRRIERGGLDLIFFFSY
jgi:autotransporter translocation and assembly factor TamB